MVQYRQLTQYRDKYKEKREKARLRKEKRKQRRAEVVKDGESEQRRIERDDSS